MRASLPLNQSFIQSRMGKRILLMFISCSLLPIILMAVLSYVHVSGQLEDQSLKRLQQMTKSVAMSILERLESVEGDLRLWKNEIGSHRGGAYHQPRPARKLHAQRFKGMVYVGANGVRVPLSGRISNLPNRVSAHLERAGNEKAQLLVETGPSDVLRIFMVMAIQGGDNPDGIVVGELNSAYLWGIGMNNNLPPLTELTILTSNGRELISSIPIASELRRRATPKSRSNATRQFTWRNNDEIFLASYWDLFLKARFSADPWIIVLSQSRKDVLSALGKFKYDFPLVLLLAFWIILLVSVRFIRRSMVPLQKLEEGTRRIMAGDFENRVELDSADEFEDLAGAFNAMNDRLRFMFNEVETIADIGRIASVETDIQNLIRRALEVLHARLDFEWGLLVLDVEIWGPHCYGAGFGRKAGADSGGTVVLPEAHHLVIHAREVAAFRQGVMCRQLPSETLPATLGPLAASLEARSIICVPIEYESGYLGILALGDHQVETIMQDSTLELLSAVAAQTAARIFNRISFQRLQESEARFREAFDHAASGLAMVSLAGRFIKANRYLQQMLGYRSEELVTMTFDQVIHTKAQDRDHRWAQPLLTGERSFVRFEKGFQHKNGEVRTAIVNASLLRNASGQPLYFISHIHDLTHQKKTEMEKKKLEASLRQAQKMEAIGTLAGGIAHDFNNILSGVGGYTELALMKAPADEKLGKYLGQIKVATDRAADLVRQILTFSRQSEQQKVPVSVGPIIKEALKLLRASLPATIAIQQQIREDGHRVLADPTQIHQIIMNLCTNALHAMEAAGGVLDVRLHPIKDTSTGSNGLSVEPTIPFLLLSISDTGCGMDNETMTRVFDPYFTTKEKDKGTGLGLAVVHGIVEGLGGSIRVDSTLGEGTTIEVLFPLTESATMKIPRKAVPVVGGQEHILFVDDEGSLAELGQLMLETLGYRVTGVTEPHEALELIRRTPDHYKLVVSDFTMPGMKGDQLASEIKQINAKIPVLICSGYGQLAIMADESRATVAGYIDKPITFDKLAQAVQEVMQAERH